MAHHRSPRGPTDDGAPGGQSRRDEAVELLVRLGAGAVPHVHGFLLDHLQRTEGLLRRWGCSETVSLAGLCHTAYGTDGFAPYLLPLDGRSTLGRTVGPEVEGPVYFYASCDRGFTYPTLAAGRCPAAPVQGPVHRGGDPSGPGPVAGFRRHHPGQRVRCRPERWLCTPRLAGLDDRQSPGQGQPTGAGRTGVTPRDRRRPPLAAIVATCR
jgi:hypothetical protein